MMTQGFDLRAYDDLWSRMVLLGKRFLPPVPAGRFLGLCCEDMEKRPHHMSLELIEFIDPSLRNDAWMQEPAIFGRMPGGL